MRIDLPEVSGGYVKRWPPVTECESIHYPQRYANVRMNGSATASERERERELVNARFTGTSATLS